MAQHQQSSADMAAAKTVDIVPAKEADFDIIWPIFKKIVSTGDTYVYAPDISYEEGKKVWFDPKFYTFLAKDGDKVVGAYVIRPNHRDLGNHVANAAYIVADEARGQGIGKQLAYSSFTEAKNVGYEAMQFNFVVSTNEIAVKLWKSVGFEIIGEVPDAYRHQVLKKNVPIYIMYRKL